MPPTSTTHSIIYSTTHYARAVSSSEAASLNGKRALTPIIAGSICGGLMGIAWIIGFSVYFYKRYKRKQLKRLAEAGQASPKEPEPVHDEPTEKIMIPPDPAVVLGHVQPGHYVVAEKKGRSSGKHHLLRVKSLQKQYNIRKQAPSTPPEPLLGDEERSVLLSENHEADNTRFSDIMIVPAKI